MPMIGNLHETRGDRSLGGSIRDPSMLANLQLSMCFEYAGPITRSDFEFEKKGCEKLQGGNFGSGLGSLVDLKA